MKLNPHSWHARVYLWWAGSSAKLPNDLCTYVWRLFWRLLFSLILIVLGIFAVSVMAVVFYERPLMSLSTVCLFLTIPLFFLLIRAYERSMLKALIDAKKHKYCPSIEWSEEEHPDA